MKLRMRSRTAVSSGSNQSSPRNGCAMVVAILSFMAWSPGGWQAAFWVAFQSGDYAASKFPPSLRHDPEDRHLYTPQTDFSQRWRESAGLLVFVRCRFDLRCQGLN